MIASDDFSGGVLDPVWSIFGPAGISSQLGTSSTDAYLELVTPDGNFDAWDTNNTARAMQTVADGDFQLETRFLTTPTEKYQIQGFLVEQDADNWIRFDTFSTGKKFYAFAAVTVDGVSSEQFRVKIPGGSAPYLRLTRTGDQWDFEHSTDGVTWVVAGSFTQALTVTAAGVFAGNTGGASGFTAQVDYFENTAAPILDEDGTIVPVNQPPVAVDDAFATEAGTALVLNVVTDLLANDSDPEGDPLVLASFGQPTNGAVIDNGNGTLSYTPNAGFTGADSFTYTASDGTSSATATVTVTVESGPPVNQPPVAVDDAFATEADTALVLNVVTDLLANDSDPEGDPLVLASFGQPTNGAVVDNGNGTLSYTPNAGFTGADSFTYTASDGTSSAAATVTVTVESGPPPPASDLASDDFSNGVLDPVWSVFGPAGISSQLGTSATDAYLELVTPDGNFDAWNTNNSARAMQTVADGDFQLETRFLTTPTEKYQIQGYLVEQDADNWIRFDTYYNGKKLYAFAAVTVDGVSSQLIRKSIPGGSAPYLRLTRTGDQWDFEHSTDGVTWVVAGSFTQALTVTAAGVFAGNTGGASGFTAQVDYFENTAAPILDEDGTIVPENQPPVVTDDGLLTPVDTALSIDVAADLLANDSDPEGDPLVLASFGQPTNGAVIDNGNGTLSYTPNAGFTGADSFTYTASDGTSSATATVTVTVESGPPVNQPPVAVDDAFATEADTALVLNVVTDLLANDSDPEGDPLVLASFGQPTNGAVVDNGNGTLSYTPNAGFTGADSFTYTASDGTSSAAATVSLNVVPPPPASDIVSDDFSNGVLDPVWSVFGPAGISSQLGTSATDAYLELATPDGNFDAWNTNNSARAMQTVADGDFQLETRFLTTPTEQYQIQGYLAEQDADNWIRFDTYYNGSGLRAFAAVTVAGSSTAQFNVSIPGGSAPYLRLTHTGDQWDFEYSTDGVTWVVAGSFTQALTVTAAGVFAGNTGGASGFTAQVDYFENTAAPILDEDGTIVPPNDPPLVIDDSYQMAPDGTLGVSPSNGVLRNDLDPEGGALTVALDSGPANGTVMLNADGSFTYSVNPGYTGADSFTYSVTDDLGATSGGTVTLNQANTAPLIVTGTSSFSKTVVSTAVPLTHIALAADFDFDGDLDIVATSEQNDAVVLFENDGAFGFTQRDLDVSLDSAYPASLADLDLDGDMDILVGGYRADQYVWYENSGAGTFTKHFIATQDGAHSIFATDLDQDGDLDLVTAGQDSNTIAWYENDGSQNFTVHAIDTGALFAKSAVPADIDGDGDIDIVTASFTDDTIAWYENDGTENFDKRVIDSDANGAYFATVADIDGDGDLDVVSASKLDDTVAWYRNDGGVFSKQLITTAATRVRYVSTTDIDGDGDIDILSANTDDNTIALYRNDGAGGFTTITVDDAAIGAYGAVPVDMDGDGLLDVLGASKVDGTVSILFQQKAHQATLDLGESLTIDTAMLQAIDAEQPASALVYTFLSGATIGELRLDGIVLGVSDSFTQEDIDLGRVSYHHTSGADGNDGFVLSLSDGIAPPSTASFAFVIGTPAPPPASDIASDDFSNGVLDPVWSIFGPAGISSQLGTSATDAFLELVTPNGNFDAWNTNNSARAMQTVADGDFQLETRFLTTPTEQYQLQGYLVEQDADNWIRFDTYFDGSSLRAFAAVTVAGSSAARLNVTIPGGSAPYLRLTRTGDQWDFEHSTDGVTWVVAGSFTQALTVTAAGVFAGNTGGASGFTAQVDYFENAAAPILDEDGTIVPVNLAPVAGDDALTTDQDSPLSIAVATDLLDNDSDPNGDALSLSGFTQPIDGVIADNGDGTFTYTPNIGFVGTDSFTYTATDGSLADTATVTIAVGSSINVWYGLEQSFGQPGEAQRWVNILGNVQEEGLVGLSYSLNGGASRTLSVGSDGKRLQNTGDFNIDIDYAELDPSVADDVITIIANYGGGGIVTQDVVVAYEDGIDWPKNYAIDWSTVSNIQDVVQIVDGTWTIDNGGLRPVDLGYDRVVAIGDQSWDNYELSLSITTHDLTNTGNGVGGGFAIGMLWTGHTDVPIPDKQPKSGWEPGAAFFYTDNDADGIGKLFLYPSVDFYNRIDKIDPFIMQEGVTYNFTVRVEQVGIYDRQYSVKIWEDGTPEPEIWTMQGIQEFALTDAPATGSIYLNAHYNDVAFNNLTVTEITGRDIIQGTDGNDVLLAVDPAQPAPGRGELDVLAGYAGADTFILGDANGAYYDDGIAEDAGEADYGFVWDFSSGTDQIQLAGTAADYALAASIGSLPAGTAIWQLGSGPDADELVGLLYDVSGLSLFSDDFVFVDSLIG